MSTFGMLFLKCFYVEKIGPCESMRLSLQSNLLRIDSVILRSASHTPNEALLCSMQAVNAVRALLQSVFFLKKRVFDWKC